MNKACSAGLYSPSLKKVKRNYHKLPGEAFTKTKQYVVILTMSSSLIEKLNKQNLKNQNYIDILNV